MATRGDLHQIEGVPKIKKDLMVGVRHSVILTGGIGSERFSSRSREKDEKVLVEVFQEYGYFVRKISNPLLELRPPPVWGWRLDKLEKMLEMKFPMPVDLVLDIRDHRENLSYHGIMYGGLLHIASFGLFPLRLDNSFNWDIRVFTGQGKLLRQIEIKDNSSIWAWSPLLFVGLADRTDKFSYDGKAAGATLRNTILHLVDELYDMTHSIGRPL